MFTLEIHQIRTFSLRGNLETKFLPLLFFQLAMLILPYHSCWNNLGNSSPDSSKIFTLKGKLKHKKFFPRYFPIVPSQLSKYKVGLFTPFFQSNSSLSCINLFWKDNLGRYFVGISFFYCFFYLAQVSFNTDITFIL